MELIVVIAMMAILIAVLVPLLSTTDTRKDEAREYARSFYSNVQELMTDERVNKNNFFDTTGGTGAKYLLVCAEVNEKVTTIDGVKVYISKAAAEPVDGNPIDFSTPEWMEMEVIDSTKSKLKNPAASSYAQFEEFTYGVQKMLMGGDITGYFFAVVDDKFRVVSAYYANANGADTDFLTVFDSDLNKAAFDKFYFIENRIVGSWPESLCDKGKTMFVIPS